MDKELTLENNSTIKWLKKSYKNYLQQTTVIYGRTRSGKSTIIEEIMYLCRNHIATPFVICQSAISAESSSFSGKIPKNCIKSDVSPEWLESFMITQKGRTAIYNIANDMIVLKSTFDKIKTINEERIENEIKIKTTRFIQSIEKNTNVDYDAKKEKVAEVQNIQKEKLIDLYKSKIRLNKNKLESNKNLSKEEKCCVNYLDFNPNAMIIFDDCASSFKKWVKASTEIKELFFNGRHYYTSLVITAQDDKEIDSGLRKNAMVSIFTTAQAASANFSRASNSYTKHEKIRSELCIKRVFKPSENSSVKNHKKLVYLQNDDSDPFLYTIADKYDSNFRLGSPSLWALDNKMNENSNSNSTNPFFNKHFDK